MGCQTWIIPILQLHFTMHCNSLGRFDGQQGIVISTMAREFAQMPKDKVGVLWDSTTLRVIPTRIDQADYLTSCHAEFVYSVEVMALKNKTGSYMKDGQYHTLCHLADTQSTGIYYQNSFQMLLPLFKQGDICSATTNRFQIDAQKWPTKNHFPAVASKRAQILTTLSDTSL